MRSPPLHLAGLMESGVPQQPFNPQRTSKVLGSENYVLLVDAGAG